jgi:hypothetical protein
MLFGNWDEWDKDLCREEEDALHILLIPSEMVN